MEEQNNQRYEVIGTKRSTGERVVVLYEAQSRDDAMKIAGRNNIIPHTAELIKPAIMLILTR